MFIGSSMSYLLDPSHQVFYLITSVGIEVVLIHLILNLLLIKKISIEETGREQVEEGFVAEGMILIFLQI